MTMFVLQEHYKQNRTRFEWLINPIKRRHNTLQYNAALYLTRNCVEYRQQAAITISNIIPIHYGKFCQIDDNPTGTTGRATMSPITKTGRRKFESNYEIYHHYKYCLVMENTNLHGYVTEKILQAYLGGCLPIYYGSSQDVYSIFTNNSFIFYDINDPQPALQLLQQLQGNDTLYEEMLNRPILKDGINTINTYLSLYPEIGNGSINKHIQTNDENTNPRIKKNITNITNPKHTCSQSNWDDVHPNNKGRL